jgi:hypothetical protein
MAANPSIQLGTDGNWAIKEDNLLAYKKDGTRFFNKEFDFTRNTTATFVDQNGLIQESDTNTPRIDFTDDATGHLLLEPQSNNLVTYSEDFNNTGWNKNQVALYSNNIISPDGTKNASKITTTDSIPWLGNNTSLTSGNTYTVSCFVKKGTNRWVRLANIASGITGAWFDLENKVVGSRSASSLSSSIKSYGNDWYRIQNTFIAQSGSANTFLGLSDANSSTSSSQNGNTVYVWGFQIEELSYATSYIPTSGSSVTRNAEVCNNSGTAQDFNSEEGVLYAEISALADDITNRVISLSNGTNNNIISVQFSNVQSNDIIAYYNATGQTGRVISTTSYNIKSFNKIALVWNNSSFKFYVNGYLIGSATIETPLVYGTLNQLKFQYGNSTLSFYGNVKDVRVFKRAMSDGELYLLTVPQYQSYQEMATALNYTL